MKKNRNIKLLTWFNFLLDFRPYGPIAIIYFAQVTGSFALGLGVFSFISLAVVLLEVPTGIFSDMVGRKKTMILGAIASTLSIFLYALGSTFWILAIGAFFGGLAESFFSGNNDALLYETLKQSKKEKKYAEMLGKVNSMFQYGLAASALLGGFLAGWSLQFVFWISIIPQFLGFILTLFIQEPRKHEKKIDTIANHFKEAVKGFKKSWKLRNLTYGSMIGFGIGETLHQFLPAFFALLWPTWALGIPRFFSHIFAAIGFHFAGKIIEKWSALKVLLSGTIIERTLSVIAFGFPTLLSPIIVAITSLPFGTGLVAQNTLKQKEFTDRQRATMSSFDNLLSNLVFAIFAFAFGGLADAIGPTTALLIGQIFLLPRLVINWRLFHHQKKVV